jgi:hypothetical protein
MGFTGRGEGIYVIANALVQAPWVWIFMTLQPAK